MLIEFKVLGTHVDYVDLIRDSAILASYMALAALSVRKIANKFAFLLAYSYL